MASLTPPVVGRDSQTIDGNVLVHKKADLLFRSEKRHEILHTILGRKLRILEWILIILLRSASGNTQQKRSRSREF